MNVLTVLEILKFIWALFTGIFRDPQSAWGNEASKSRTFWVIILCISICSFMTYLVYGKIHSEYSNFKSEITTKNKLIDSLISSSKISDQSIYDMSFEKEIDSYIKEACVKSGDGTFMCCVKLEKNKDKHFIFFKRAIGFYKSKSDMTIDLSDYNRFYKNANLEVDSNTYKYIAAELDENKVYLMTEEYAFNRNFDIIRTIFANQNLPIQRFKFTVVKNKFGSVIWFFSISRLDNKLDHVSYETYLKDLANMQRLKMDGLFIPSK